MPAQHVMFPSAELGGPLLEGLLELPDVAPPFPGVAICHPHPLYGGNMHNNVVDAVCRALAPAGIACLRFNFRGVGGSQGEHSGGAGEQDDARGALTYLLSSPGVDGVRAGLAGYSFGARTAMAVAAADAPVTALAVISSTSRGLDASADLAGFNSPKLFICGDRDTNVTPDELRAFVEGLREPKEVRIVRGADHFWGGYEDALGEAVGGFFLKAFDGSS